MGAWSTESFGNDTACDWGYGLEDAADLTLVRDTIQKVISREGYVDASDAEEAIAAIEVVARLKGNFGRRDAYSETVDKWVQDHPLRPEADLLAASVQALKRIMTSPSELLELWQESDEFEKWKDGIRDLEQRVSK